MMHIKNKAINTIGSIKTSYPVLIFLNFLKNDGHIANKKLVGIMLSRKIISYQKAQLTH